MTDTTTDDLTGLDGLDSDTIVALHEAFVTGAVDTTPEAPAAPAAPVSVPTLYGGWVSTAQAEGFMRLIEGAGLTEQQIHARYPDIPVTNGPAVFTRFSREIEANRDAAMAGLPATQFQVERLRKGIEAARAAKIFALVQSGERVFDDIEADRLKVSRAIDALETRLKVRGIATPWTEQAETTEVNAGALEGSTVTGAVPAEEPF